MTEGQIARSSVPKCCLPSEISVTGCLPTVDQLCFISPALNCVLCSQAAPGNFGSRLDTSSAMLRTSSSYSLPSSLAESKIRGWNRHLSGIFSMHSEPCLLVGFRNTDWPPRWKMHQLCWDEERLWHNHGGEEEEFRNSDNPVTCCPTGDSPPAWLLVCVTWATPSAVRKILPVIWSGQ